MKHIGVVSHLRLPELPTELKRYALFFDEVQIVGMDLEEVRKKYRFLTEQEQLEIDFLYNSNFLVEGKLNLHSAANLPPDAAKVYLSNAAKMRIAGEYMEADNNIATHMQPLIQMIDEWEEQGQDSTPLKVLYNKFAEMSAVALVRGLNSFPLAARQIAMNLSLFENQKAACIGELDYRSAGDDAGPATPDTIYEIAVNDLPVPELTPWQEILAFKSDKENQKRLLAFHVWVSDISKNNLSKAEITDKIKHLKQEYTEALNVAKMKHYPGIFKAY
jgi:hypothetical protein